MRDMHDMHEMHAWSFEAAVCRRARASNRTRVDAVRSRTRRLSRPRGVVRRTRSTRSRSRETRRLGRELKDRSNDRTIERGRDDGEIDDESERGEGKERVDVDADEPEDAISRTDDAR